MKSKTVLLSLAASLVIAASPMGWAQQAGFGIGVAQAHFGPPPNQTAPVHPPAVAVRSTFQVVPGLVTPVAPPITPFPVPIVPLVPNFPTVIVPNQILIVDPGLLPQVTPAQPVNGLPVFPAPVRERPGPGRPLPGTPRGDVIRQFGAPSVTVVTSTGETLYFSGGVTVIIQNGQVVGPK